MAKKTVKEIKKDQGHTRQGPICSNCESFTSNSVTTKNQYGSWTEDKNKKCNLGKFATGKTNWCPGHVWNK